MTNPSTPSTFPASTPALSPVNAVDHARLLERIAESNSDLTGQERGHLMDAASFLRDGSLPGEQAAVPALARQASGIGVGDTKFESWFEYQPFATFGGDIKQNCRDAYAAGHEEGWQDGLDLKGNCSYWTQPQPSTDEQGRGLNGWVPLSSGLPQDSDGDGWGNVLAAYADRTDHYGVVSAEFVRRFSPAFTYWRRVPALPGQASKLTSDVITVATLLLMRYDLLRSLNNGESASEFEMLREALGLTPASAN